ncbi:peptidoglycan DD-metalloendopeptidase family protein [Nocardia sp. NPDC052566]|uniref:peptidoglycan DD-metalloendopeptidase family protein n=1 Tax=Nocardia sp. NPDC052566 TaxID=3364330 RepID=UPI0037CB6C3A
MIAGKVALDAASAVTGRRKRTLITVAALAVATGGGGVALLIMTLIIAMLGAVGGSSIAAAATACGISRPPLTASTPAPALTGVKPGSLVVPLAAGTYTVSSPFGMRWGEVHDGQDFAAALGTPIYAAADGDVVAAGPADGYGNWIRLRHVIDGQTTIETLYGHMKSGPDDLRVRVGDRVHAGQQIAQVGHEGNSTGPHLHLGVYIGQWQPGRGVDPAPWLQQQATTSPAPNSSNNPTAPPAATPALTPATNLLACTSSQGQLKPGTVPSQYLDAVLAAGRVCGEVIAPLIAAQIEQESDWRTDVVSEGDGVNQGGAKGMAQFLDGTWQKYGTDSGLDHNGQPTGPDTPDPFNPYDAIASQARYDCHIAEVLRPAIAAGQVKGDLIDLILAGYNAGENAVLTYGRIPPFPQTQKYVPDIRDRMARYTDLTASTAPTGPAPAFTVPGSPFAQALIAAASTQIGLPYVWGGGNSSGPTAGAGETGEIGFDCSGLILYAVAQASHGTITLPHLTNEQVKYGRPVTGDAIAPGDVVFTNATGHVGIWLGSGQILDAYDRGTPVAIRPFDLRRAEDIRRYG